MAREMAKESETERKKKIKIKKKQIESQHVLPPSTSRTSQPQAGLAVDGSAPFHTQKDLLP